MAGCICDYGKLWKFYCRLAWITAETVSRQLEKIQNKGILEIKNKKIIFNQK